MALVAFSCAKEEDQKDLAPERPAVDYEGQEITVHFGVEMPEPQTKALGDEPNITSLHVAVFGSSGYLKNISWLRPWTVMFPPKAKLIRKAIAYSFPLLLPECAYTL